jgi:hypothetical protein
MTAYSFYKDAKDGDTVTLENGARYQYQEAKNRWVVKSVHDEDECPRFDAIATQYKDLNTPKEQIAINWLPSGNQAGSQGFSEVRLCNFLREIDTSNGWLSIDGNKHLIYRVDSLGGDPLIQLMSFEGDLSSYIGSTVEVHACEEE